jgi:hypothetical protein
MLLGLRDQPSNQSKSSTNAANMDATSREDNPPGTGGKDAAKIESNQLGAAGVGGCLTRR